MELSPVERILIALSTLGPDHYYEHPGKMVPIGAGPRKEAAMVLDLEALEEAVREGAAVHPQANPRWFDLTDLGQERVWKALGIGEEAIKQYKVRRS